MVDGEERCAFCCSTTVSADSWRQSRPQAGATGASLFVAAADLSRRSHALRGAKGLSLHFPKPVRTNIR